ncbi:MAG: hypothetical protein WCF40_09160, partial [Desulfobacterales bacterium]
SSASSSAIGKRRCACFSADGMLLETVLFQERDHLKITSRFGRECILSGCDAKTQNTPIFLLFLAFLVGRSHRSEMLFYFW